MKKSGYRSTIVLPPGSTGADLQAAIDQAVFGDVIQLSGDMTFTDAVTVRQFLEINITSTPGDSWVISKPNANTRHFVINGGSLNLENITLDGGGRSGGIHLNQGAFGLLDGAVIQNCAAVEGGGVYVVSGVFSIYGGTIEKNSAQSGGGIYMANGTLNISASEGIIRNNTATESGGGIYIENGFTLSLEGGEISGNQAPQGGGMYVNSGAFTMNRGIFSNNIADENGGALYVAAQATAAISGAACSITGNSAINGDGGGIYTADTTYANITSTGDVVFSCNIASAAYSPPPASQYPNIRSASATIAGHPLNNFDISYTAEAPISGVFNLTYHANGGEGGHVGPDTTPCGEDTVLVLEDTQITRAGHNFTGWNTAADGGGVPHAPGDVITLTDNMTLYAQWEADLYAIIYGANGGKGGYTDTDIPHGTAYTVMTAENTGIWCAGHTFSGWNTEPDGSGTACAPGDTLTISGGMFLYAQWQANLYKVVYEANGGFGTRSDTDLPHGTEYMILTQCETGITRKGYRFNGWNTEPDGSGTAYAPGDVTVLTGNMTLYAQWTPFLYMVVYKTECGCGGHVDTDIPYGAVYTVLTPDEAAVSRAGYHFICWNTEADGCGISYKPGDAITLISNITFYAQWKSNDEPYSCSDPCKSSYSDPCKKPYSDLCSKIFKKSSCRPDDPQ